MGLKTREQQWSEKIEAIAQELSMDSPTPDRIHALSHLYEASNWLLRSIVTGTAEPLSDIAIVRRGNELIS